MTANRYRYVLTTTIYTQGARKTPHTSEALQKEHEKIRKVLGQDPYRGVVNAADYEPHGTKGRVHVIKRLNTELLQGLQRDLSGIAHVALREVEARDRAALRQERLNTFAALETRTDAELPSFEDVTRREYGRPVERK